MFEFYRIQGRRRGPGIGLITYYGVGVRGVGVWVSKKRGWSVIYIPKRLR